MNSFSANEDTRKGVSSKDSNPSEKRPTSQGLNPTAPAFTPKTLISQSSDKDKTPSGLGVSQEETELEEEFPGLTETRPIPVWVSQESGQELSNSQLRRRRRWRKSAREAEERKALKEQQDLKAEYAKLNEEEAGPSDWVNRRQNYKKKRGGFLNNVKPRDGESK
ncbi:Ff.00g036690.m01.CDS01 [Fusarium sp. VM40]|nr:Ff.00g036690.m01.CDS01 [Fusarium sp. VM40]